MTHKAAQHDTPKEGVDTQLKTLSLLKTFYTHSLDFL